VVLIPIRSNDSVMGLIHLADPRENMVPPHLVDAMERASGLMGSAIQRTLAETELHAALAEKTLLLREVHHRVKNNLAAIIGLLDLQRRSTGDIPTPAVLGGLADRIKSMALVHEHLYRNADLAHIDFEQYLKALISHLSSSLGTRSSLHCTVSAIEVEMGLDVAIPCGMIVNELVTNAIRHAFPAGSPRPGTSRCELTVSMTRDGATYTLIVADNGVGLPSDFDWATAKSLGLRLVRMLGEHQLGARVAVDGSNGTRVELKFDARK
jgi:two-component sensor histidine kinase